MSQLLSLDNDRCALNYDDKRFSILAAARSSFHLNLLERGCGSGSAKNLPLPLPHMLFDLKSNLAKKFSPYPNVD